MEPIPSASTQSKGSVSRQTSANSKDNGNRTPALSGCCNTVAAHAPSDSSDTEPPSKTSISKIPLPKKSSYSQSRIRVSKSRSSVKPSICPCINALKGSEVKLPSSRSLLPGVNACMCDFDPDDSKGLTNTMKTTCKSVSQSTSVQSFNQSCRNKSSVTHYNTLEEFEKHVDRVIDMTFKYQGEGLLCRTENFLKCCQGVKDKIKQHKESREVKEKLNHLKEHVTNLENMTDTVVKQELSATSLGNFLSSCKQFKNKLDHHNVAKGPPISSVHNLVTQINESISLSNEAKKKGLVTSESVDEFIKNCNRIKARILEGPQVQQKQPEMIDKLLGNINDILGFISKYEKDGLVSDSIENFYRTCLSTKSKLSGYKKYSGKGHKRTTSGEQGTSTQCRPKTCGGASPCRKTSSKTLSFEMISKRMGSGEKRNCCRHSLSKVRKQPSPSSSLTQCVECSKSASSSKQSSPCSSLPRITPCTKSTCTQCTHSSGSNTPKGFIESVCSSCSEMGKSIISLLKGKNPVKQQVSIIVIKRLQEDNKENSETTTLKQRDLDSQRKPVTSQKSIKCVKEKDGSIPAVGSILTVRPNKSACEFSNSCMPLVWSRISLDAAERKYDNPFFCGSPTESDTEEF